MPRTHDCRDVPVARSFLARTAGLLGRPADASLFIPRCASIHTWFMAHAIDVIFLDDVHVVVAIHHSLAPWRIAHGGARARDVVELPAGAARQRGFEVGDVVSLAAT